MPDDLHIKLVLDAVNNMSGKMDGAVRDMEKVSRAMDNMERHSHRSNLAKSGSLLDPSTWSALMKNSEVFTDRMNRLQWSGMDKMMVGGAMLAPVVATVKAAGDLEEIMNQIKIDTYDSSVSAEEWARRVALLRETTVDLSKDVKYGAAEIGDAVDSLVRGNVAVQDVANGAARAAVYLAQASKGEVSTGGAAEGVAKLGNAWQLTGKELEEVADTLARVDAASTASIPSLLEGFKYVSATASNLKIPVRDTAVALGVLNNAGLDASTAGTTLNQMLQSLQPTTKAAKDMFEQMGLSVENNPFYDVNGRLKPMIEIIKVLRTATADMTDQQKQLAFSKIFDERGSRAVVNLLKEGKNSYEDIEGSLSRQMSLWDRIKTQNQGLNAQVDILKGNLSTLLSESGSPLGKELTGTVAAANDFVVALTEWSKQNPEIATWILKTTGYLGGFTLALGGAQFAVAGLLKAWAPVAGKIMAGSTWAVQSGVAGTAAALAAPAALAYGEYKLLKHFEPQIERFAFGAESDAEVARMKQSAADLAEMNRQMVAAGIIQQDASGQIVSIDNPRADKFMRDWALSHPSIKTNFGSSSQNAPAGPVNITIYARDAQETAREVQRVLDRPTTTKYQNSWLPLQVDPRREE